MKTSEYSGFYKLSVEERLNEVAEFAGLTEEDKKVMLTGSALPMDAGDRMIENVIGQMPLPFGVAINFLINGKDYVIPMAVEEASIVAPVVKMSSTRITLFSPPACCAARNARKRFSLRSTRVSVF